LRVATFIFLFFFLSSGRVSGCCLIFRLVLCEVKRVETQSKAKSAQIFIVVFSYTSKMKE